MKVISKSHLSSKHAISLEEELKERLRDRWMNYEEGQWENISSQLRGLVDHCAWLTAKLVESGALSLEEVNKELCSKLEVVNDNLDSPNLIEELKDDEAKQRNL